jgi:hypothetical protein
MSLSEWPGWCAIFCGREPWDLAALSPDVFSEEQGSQEQVSARAHPNGVRCPRWGQARTRIVSSTMCLATENGRKCHAPPRSGPTRQVHALLGPPVMGLKALALHRARSWLARLALDLFLVQVLSCNPLTVQNKISAVCLGWRLKSCGSIAS